MQTRIGKRDGCQVTAPVSSGEMSLPTVLEVLPGTPAAIAGLCAGDELLAINGVVPNDVI